MKSRLMGDANACALTLKPFAVIQETDVFSAPRLIPTLTILVGLSGLSTNSYAVSVLTARAALTDGYIADVYDSDAGYGYTDYLELPVDSAQGSGTQTVEGSISSYNNGTVLLSNDGNPLGYSAMALADYGALKARAEISKTGPLAEADNYSYGPPYPAEFADPYHAYYSRTGVTSTASALFRDQWTISGQPSGTPGTLQLTYNIDGSKSGDAGGVLRIWNYYNTYSTSHFGSNLSPTAILEIPFVFGTPLDFGIELLASAFLEPLSAGGSQAGGYGVADYFNTAILEAIAVKDTSGNVVPFDLSTASNAAAFNDLVSPVPLPAAVWLFGSSLLGMIGIARRKKAA